MPLSDDLKAWIDAKDKEIDNLEANLQGLTDAIGKVSGDVLSLSSRLDSLKASMDTLGLGLGENSDDLNDFETRLGKLESWQATHGTHTTSPTPTDPPPVDPNPVPEPDKPPAPSSPPQIPADAFVVPLCVRESAGVARSRAFVSTGVPIPEDLNVENVSRLALIDEKGFWIEADFRPTSWRRTAGSPNGIQWVQVSFFDGFAPTQEKSYKLVISQGPWHTSSLSKITAQHTGNVVAVDTGNLGFLVSGKGITCLSNGSNVFSTHGHKIRFDGVDNGLATITRKLEIEYVGTLMCYVYVEVETDLKFGQPITSRPAIGKDAAGKPIYPQGSVVISRRYEFRADSGVVMCQQTVKWEGTKNGTNWLDTDGVKVNGILGEEWSETFTVPDAVQGTFLVRVDDSLDGLQVEELSGNESRVEQGLRENRTRARFVKTGLDADIYATVSMTGGMLQVNRNGSSVLFGLYHMDKYEPQALQYDGDEIKVSYASDKFWLAHRQGTHVKSMIAVTDKNKVLDDDSILEYWAELNHPLRIFAKDSAYYSASNLSQVPTNAISFNAVNTVTPTLLSSLNKDKILTYQAAIKSLCDATLFNIDRFGTYGLQTYASFPRYWGSNDSGDEVGWPKTGGAKSWDSLYREGAWTDYYSSSRSATTLALMSGDSTYLDTLAFPSAWRVLHTQIFSGAPDDTYPYIGWAPTGYNAYRGDFNSSHSYFENLYWYYCLTGDRQVVDILTRGAETNVRALSNPNNRLAGRFPNQHLGCIRFLKHAHYDAAKGQSFGQAFDTLVSRAIKENYIESTFNGDTVAVWVDARDKTNPDVWYSLNHYAYAIWDVETLYLYSLENPDKAEIVNNIIYKTAKTLIKYGSKLVGGDGSVGGKWSRTFKVVYNPTTKTISSLVNKQEPGETVSLLYPDDKPGMAAWWALASRINPQDTEMRRYAEELVQLAINRITTSKLPMGKLMGLCETRLMRAVAVLTESMMPK